jgi:integrase
VGDDRATVGDFLDIWLRDVVTPSCRPSTVTSYRGVVDNHIRPELGHIRLTKLRSPHVQRLIAAKASSELSARTVEYIWQVLRRALNVAVGWRLLELNPADQAKPPRPPRQEVTPLLIEDVRRILAAAKNHPREAAFVLALTTGMRRGEILSLRWADFDFDSSPASVRVSRALARVDGELVDGEPKSVTGRRTIMLTRVAVEVLHKHRLAQFKLKMASEPGWNDLDRVFVTATGNGLDGRNLNREWHELLKTCGVRACPLHVARHTAATLMLSEGVPLKVVQTTLGHKSMTLTADTYGHFIEDDGDKVATAMDRVFGG